MKFGLFTWFNTPVGRPHSEAFPRTFSEIDAAEQMGWDTVWVVELHLCDDILASSCPFVLAAAVAARTKQVKIALGVHTPRLRRPGEDLDSRGPVYGYTLKHLLPACPIQTAEQGAMIDQISQGRFIYGAGGLTWGDPERRAQFLEFLAIIRQIWRERAFTGFKGEYFDYPAFPEGHSLSPEPYQTAGPPVLLAVDSQASFEAFGTLGYRIAVGGGIAHNRRGDAAIREDVKAYRRAWKEAGHPGEPSVMVRIPTYIASTAAEVQRTGDAILANAAAFVARRPQRPTAAPGAASPESAEQVNLFATPEEAVDRIRYFQEELGADEMILEPNYYGALTHEQVLETMRLITDRVIPAFK